MDRSPFAFHLGGHRDEEGRFAPYTQELYRVSPDGSWMRLGIDAWRGCEPPTDVEPLTHDEAVRWRDELVGVRMVAPWADTSVDFPHDLPPTVEPEPRPMNAYDRAAGESERLRVRIMFAAWAVAAVVVLVVTVVRWVA